jgi:DNA-binding NarL/FixJ family response regulator
MNIFTAKLSAEPRVRLVVANLPMILSDLLRRAFEMAPDIDLLEPVNDLRPLLDKNAMIPTDTILLGSSGVNNVRSALSILSALPEQHRNARVIVLTQNPDYAEVISLFRAGVRGILCVSDLRFDLLCKCIRCVHQGQIWANNELLLHLVNSLSHPQSREVTDSYGKPLLTTREQQVLHLLADGLSNSELASVLKLSEHTIKNHLFRIYDKLGVSSRMEAVLYALTPRTRLATPEDVTSNVRSQKIRMMRQIDRDRRSLQ